MRSECLETPLTEGFSACERCGELSFERLESYGHCANCLYTEDFEGMPHEHTLPFEEERELECEKGGELIFLDH